MTIRQAVARIFADHPNATADFDGYSEPLIDTLMTLDLEYDYDWGVVTEQMQPNLIRIIPSWWKEECGAEYIDVMWNE